MGAVVASLAWPVFSGGGKMFHGSWNAFQKRNARKKNRVVWFMVVRTNPADGFSTMVLQKDGTWSPWTTLPDGSWGGLENVRYFKEPGAKKMAEAQAVKLGVKVWTFWE
ncbi:MAG: hypothetical protein ACREGR_03230 [Minisyncoccia bacterium]